MYCRNCGKETIGNRELCDDCMGGGNVQLGPWMHNSGRKKCCPRCKSRNLQILTNTEYHSQTKGGGYSASNGCCGYILLGPLGLLCGACGSGSKTTVTSSSTNVWVCRDCGNQFRDVADIDKDIENAENGKKANKWIGIIMGVFIFFFSYLVNSMIYEGNGSVFIICLLVSLGIVVPASIFWGKSIDNELYALKQERDYIERNGYIDV